MFLGLLPIRLFCLCLPLCQALALPFLKVRLDQVLIVA